MYRGKHGLLGFVSFSIVGLCYKIFGVSSKLFGKALFIIFLKAIPTLVKGIINLFI